MKNNNKGLKIGFKINTFIVFLVLSLLFWVLIKLSKTYSDEVTFKLNYINLPTNKVMQVEPLKKVHAIIQSTGFNLLSYNFKPKTLLVDLSAIKQYKNRYYYLPNNHLTSFKSQLETETQINSVKTDTIFFILGQNISKKIPVILDANLQFKLGYDYDEAIQLIPDSIVVSGPKLQIDTLKFLKTHFLELKNISSKIDKKVKLNTSKYSDLKFSLDETRILLNVDKYTEGSIKIPFKVINVPKNYTITTLPKEVQVIYKVGLKNFSKITAESFKIECDYQLTDNNNLTYLKPVVVQKPILIRSIKLKPDKIDFLIEEK